MKNIERQEISPAPWEKDWVEAEESHLDRVKPTSAPIDVCKKCEDDHGIICNSFSKHVRMVGFIKYGVMTLSADSIEECTFRSKL
jgi:hypothetical protein